LVEAIYLFICYDVPNAADGWNRSLYSFSFSLPFPSSLFLPWVCMHASPLLVLKKIMTRTHIWRRDRKKKSGQPLPLPPSPRSCVRAMISSLSFSLLSKDSRRGTHKAHSTHTHSSHLFFLCPYVYLHSNVVKSKSFYRSQCIHSSTILGCFFKYT
jgi:hypothetical protein